MRVHVGRGGGSGVSAVRGWGWGVGGGVLQRLGYECACGGGEGARRKGGVREGVGVGVRDLELNRTVPKVSAR